MIHMGKNLAPQKNTLHMDPPLQTIIHNSAKILWRLAELLRTPRLMRHMMLPHIMKTA
jgi:hypothetical protein